MMQIPDACPECPPPFDVPGSLPDASGVHECRAGHRWRTARDAWGWPLERMPVLVPPLTRPSPAADWPSERAA